MMMWIVEVVEILIMSFLLLLLLLLLLVFKNNLYKINKVPYGTSTVKINYTMKIITAYITKKIIPIIFANIIPVRNDTVPFFF